MNEYVNLAPTLNFKVAFWDYFWLVFALVRELDGTAILDESIARQVARIYNIQAHGTVYLLLRLIYRGKLSRDEARKAIERMISAG